MKKRWIAVMMCLILWVSIFAGCASKTTDDTEQTKTDGVADQGSKDTGAEEESLLPEDDLTETIEFTTWMYADEYKHYTSYEENPVVKYLNEKFNVSMKFQLPAMGAEADNFNLMLGTGDYTEVMNMTYSSESLSSLYEDGVIIDLAPYLEEYMPNYYALLQENEELRKTVYDDEGHAFGLYTMEDLTRNQWGGMAYRRDILEVMTGGNVAFPSGNAEPTTVEDWDYMLPLMKAYFDASGMTDTACLIIPACGYIVTGELVAGFGTSAQWQIAEDGKSIEFGAATDEFYNYVSKMHEWYEAGYIYQDFASRTNDLFYLPNPALTYGAAAGTWFALLQQVGTAMSMPDYGLNVDVHAVAAPLDTEHGVTAEDAGFYVFNGLANNPFCISTSCDEEKLARVLTVMDFLYTEEGAYLRAVGLSGEQAQNDELYQSLGLENGAYYYNEAGEFCLDEKLILDENESGIKYFSLQGGRLPGASLPVSETTPANKERTENDDAQDVAGDVWVSYGRDRQFPSGATLNVEESTQYNSCITNIFDHIDTMIPKFIMGTEELNEETWKEFVDTLYSLGLDKALAAQQSAYDRYLAR